jgi:hypothetical protein
LFLGERIVNKFLRILKLIVRIIIYIPKKIIRGIVNTIKDVGRIVKRKYNNSYKIKARMIEIEKQLENQKTNYIGICHPEWIGVRNATKDLFENEVIEIKEIATEKEARLIAQRIVDAGKEMVCFNAFAYGWDNIARNLKKINSSILIRLVIHGSNALLSEPYDWDVFRMMLQLYDEKVIDQIGFVKKSLYEFYKAKGYNVFFLMNDVNIENKEEYITKAKEKNENKLKIGFYASGDRWVKNSYNQISAASLFKDAVVDVLPINFKTETMANLYQVNLQGTTTNVSREEMYKRLANNDINFYVTFTECAPLIPLESLELGTICITGNNHHYFENSELEKYLVVNRPDDIMAIYEKANYALEHKDEIMSLYKKWKEDYSKEVKKNRQEFFELKK